MGRPNENGKQLIVTKPPSFTEPFVPVIHIIDDVTRTMLSSDITNSTTVYGVYKSEPCTLLEEIGLTCDFYHVSAEDLNVKVTLSLCGSVSVHGLVDT